MKKRLLEQNSRPAAVLVLAFCFLCAVATLPAQTLKITSPANGTVVNPGDFLRVTVVASGAKFDMVVLMGGDSLGFHGPAHEDPYEFSTPIPSDIPLREYVLTASGDIAPGGTGIDVSDSITIDVERPDAPVKLDVQPSVLSDLSVGDLGYLCVVNATFSDGATLNVDYSTLLSYRSDTPAVAKVDAYGTGAMGIIKALAPGSANIVVSYGKVSFRVPVTVRHPVTVVPSRVRVNASQTRQFYEQLALQTEADHTVTWSIRPPVGSIDNSGLYTAPSRVTAPTRVTVTATSVANETWYGSAELLVIPAVSVRPATDSK